MSTALYRRYRPETFAEVIGQEHVTEPLMQALRTNRTAHAYLFSGPRGCGKTTSARILARCLNCAEGPTPTPCGVCDSCVELGRGGPGSLDVVEIDAASHGGVDDARDLRERATFAPTRDRFKIFILDEAHMVSPQGFNALLKIVEEPPPHVKFIFATTEPDKVIGTIRSRTHHYPFRLVGPGTLQPYLEQICGIEGVAVGSGVLPLVVRAGGGSVRDSLSVLDQLVAGADAGGLDYERAVSLLGYTHATLLDDAVDAVAARDGASAFRVVDRVVSSGHEPRRFVEDLLERLRDLIVIAASGEAAEAVLRDLPADQLERMRAQAAVLGPSELSRSADLVNAALTEMMGATSPRLHLELLVARLLLPAADDGSLGLGARLDRVERALTGTPAPAQQVIPAPAPPQPSAAPARRPVRPQEPAGDSRDEPREPAGERATEPGQPPHPAAGPRPPAGPSLESPRPEPVASVEQPPADVPPEARADDADAADVPTPPSGAVDPSAVATPPAARPPATARPPAPVRTPAQDRPPAAAGAPAAVADRHPGLEAETVRRRWPEVLQTLRGLRMATWVLVDQNAQVGEVTADRVTLAFTTPQLASTFRSGAHSENVQRALRETLGLDVRVETALTESAVSGERTGGWSAAGQPAGRAAEIVGGPETPRQSGDGASRARTATDAAGRISADDAEASWGSPGGSVRDRGTSAGAEAAAAAPAAAGSPAPTGSRAPSVSTAATPRRTPPSPDPTRPLAGTVAGAAGARRPDPVADLPGVAEPGEEIPVGEEPDEGVPTSAGAAAHRPASPAASRATGRFAGAPGPRGGAVASRPLRPSSVDDGDDADPDDPDLSGLVGAPLVAQMLGGTVIDEIPDDIR